MALEISYAPQFAEKTILVIDIYNCQTDPEARMFKKGE